MTVAKGSAIRKTASGKAHTFSVMLEVMSALGAERNLDALLLKIMEKT